jgi:hypothetical protein
MKKCTSCKIEKSFESFYDRLNATGENVRTSRCKSCIKERTKTWRKAEGKEQWKGYEERRVAGNMQFLQDERAKGCQKCGETRPYVVDFHHLDPAQKSFTIGATNRWTRTQLTSELQKCIRLCKNCHAELHYLEKFHILDMNSWLKA